MNTVWSDNVQGILTLYLSRKLRFDDLFSPQYKALFGLEQTPGMRILEIGCGPGALAGALKRWYPEAEITGLDRDSRFIAFAKKQYPTITFLEGDAAELPFDDESFDVTISNTVQEHVEPTAFWGEQRRVLKPGGICLCLSARKGICRRAPCLEMTDEEKAFWDRHPNGNADLETYQIGKYAATEDRIPAEMEKQGFSCVSTGYVVMDLTPDDPKYSDAMAEAMIEAERQGDLEAIDSVRAEDAADAKAAVHAKYDTRLQLYRSGVKQWDTLVHVTMVNRGRKR